MNVAFCSNNSSVESISRLLWVHKRTQEFGLEWREVLNNWGQGDQSIKDGLNEEKCAECTWLVFVFAVEILEVIDLVTNALYAHLRICFRIVNWEFIFIILNSQSHIKGRLFRSEVAVFLQWTLWCVVTFEKLEKVTTSLGLHLY